ncbi:MAG TPA: SDR family NAD(P)-dependent oxidoreductase [Pyrinomonadaceae bacterium]|jgi:NAD(P)-dependent dehydrogenase (short-subunit alcohol dehydrogenase family)|nr:SDR family NAD(P)-dependent oxidoreductase [Pyrinomonadaceae bacterium]
MTQGRLDGKVAIITGATGGIGEATAKRFLEEGASVMLVGRSADKLRDTHARLAPDDRIAEFVADATDEKATAAAVDATIAAFGGVDILLANAGTEGVIAPIENQTVENFEDVLRTNVIGVWLSMKYCVEPMKKRGRGSMIALSSISGVIGVPSGSPYFASKHAVCGLVKCAALELGSFDIRVNAIAPGPIDNRMIRAIEEQLAPDAPDAVREGFLQSIPMKRYGESEEVANLALFLASDEASYCTGGIHMIDGGYTAA